MRVGNLAQHNHRLAAARDYIFIAGEETLKKT